MPAVVGVGVEVVAGGGALRGERGSSATATSSRYARSSRGIEEGQFRDVDPEAATLAVFGICNWAYQWWHPGSGADPALMAQRMWDLIIRGLGVKQDLRP